MRIGNSQITASLLIVLVTAYGFSAAGNALANYHTIAEHNGFEPRSEIIQTQRLQSSSVAEIGNRSWKYSDIVTTRYAIANTPRSRVSANFLQSMYQQN